MQCPVCGYEFTDEDYEAHVPCPEDTMEVE